MSHCFGCCGTLRRFYDEFEVCGWADGDPQNYSLSPTDIFFCEDGEGFWTRVGKGALAIIGFMAAYVVYSM